MNRIAELRKEKKISQSKLGEIVGAAQNTVCNWENGNREPDLETLSKLSKYFGVTTDYLMGNEIEDLPDDLILFNRKAKNLTQEQRKQLFDVAKAMFKEDFDD